MLSRSAYCIGLPIGLSSFHIVHLRHIAPSDGEIRQICFLKMPMLAILSIFRGSQTAGSVKYSTEYTSQQNALPPDSMPSHVRSSSPSRVGSASSPMFQRLS